MKDTGNILQANFGNLMILLLTEMKDHNEVIATDSSGKVYYIESLIEEIKQETNLAQTVAKSIIGVAFEIAMRNVQENHIKRNKEAQDHFDSFMEKYGKWLVTDEERDNG